jgi:hypothetical protein
MLLECARIGAFVTARRCGGLWQYLIARAKGKTSLELERERNRATVEALRQLPPGYEILEYEREGRLRVIRRNMSSAGLERVSQQSAEPERGILQVELVPSCSAFGKDRTPNDVRTKAPDRSAEGITHSRVLHGTCETCVIVLITQRQQALVG